MTVRPFVSACVHRLTPGKNNPRNSEGSFIHLDDGRLMYVYTYFTDGTNDDSHAYLAACYSEDEGKTWSNSDEAVVADVGGRNVMSASFLRLRNGRIALFYLIKVSPPKQPPGDWRVLMRISEDEAKTWSEPTQCSPTGGRYVLNNDRAIQLSNGRIVLPVAHSEADDANWSEHETIKCLLSDDMGQTWHVSSDELRVQDVWTQEPGIIELNDSRLMLFCRTQVGRQYVSYSSDGGDHWCALQPSDIVSSLSPASMKRISQTGDLLLTWNPVNQPWNGWESLQRSPLCTAISSDEGKTWQHRQIVADDPDYWFCYAAVTFTNKHVLLAHSAGTGHLHERLATQQITRLPLSMLYDN